MRPCAQMSFTGALVLLHCATRAPHHMATLPCYLVLHWTTRKCPLPDHTDLPSFILGHIRVLHRTTTKQTSAATFMAPRHSHHRQSTSSLHHDLAWGASRTSTTTASQRGRLRFAVASGGGCGALREVFSARNQVYHRLER
jgi:hypothetical protein